MKALKITRPLAVVDCNFIQGCRNEQNDVPAHFDCLIIPQLFQELLSKPESERDFLLTRFTTWTRRNIDRLWVMHDWGELIPTMEATPERVRRIRLRHILSHFRTRIFRKYIRDENFRLHLPESNPEFHHWVKEDAKGRRDFVAFTDECRAFGESLPGRPKDKFPHTPEGIRQEIQNLNIADFIIHRSGNGEYGDWRWRRHFQGFPDRLFIARFARLNIYYAYRRSLGDRRKFENNWDDMYYALAASYTGHIATSDNGLITATGIIAPGMRVIRQHLQN
jgi:hypothetical protein